MRGSKRLLIFALAACTAGLSAEEPSTWFKRVSPIMTGAERTAYLALSPEARTAFEKQFWTSKAISEADFLERCAVADTRFGSGRAGSGLNTDEGRVYVSVGPPNRITRLPSSRSFFPLEIWYYESVPALGISSELRLIFYQKNGLGEPRLYSPTVDTVRALMTPQASTRGMFGPNQNITASTVNTQLTTRPVENEVAEAAISVAAGVTGPENEQILASVSSPATALSGNKLRTGVSSRLLAAHGKMEVVQTVSPYGATQVDLALPAKVQNKLRIEVRQQGALVYGNETQFHFDHKAAVRYQQRLDLLPGEYSVLLHADGESTAYPLSVAEAPGLGEIVFADDCPRASEGASPWTFSGACLVPAIHGSKALIALRSPEPVTWSVHRGTEVVWKKAVAPAQVSVIDLPSVARGKYVLEAATSSGSSQAVFEAGASTEPDSTIVSFNANLRPAQRLVFVGHQWLMRANTSKAREALNASLAAMPSNNDAAWIELSRLDAAEGKFDEARASLRSVLNANPDNFDALATLGYVEAKLQDYPVAAELFRHALRVQDSETIRMAFALLPQK